MQRLSRKLELLDLSLLHFAISSGRQSDMSLLLLFQQSISTQTAVSVLAIRVESKN
jgi:hypothetical protein